MNTPGQKVPNMLLDKSGEIAPEIVKRLSQSENNPQLWVWLVMEVKINAVKTILHKNPDVRSMNQGKLEVIKQEIAKSEHWQFRKQWTKMD